mgnify:CR=1 FL=1|tara:strand:+ start:999 stop:1421 length:423 start_codon:yes stop_codon:yes gene_type:complete
MNNKERLLWLSGIIFLAFFCMNKIDHIASLEILDRNNQLSHRLQADQINDLTSRLNEAEGSGYEKGFREGESYALIASLNGEELYDYADGYHAALAQFVPEKKSNIDQDTYSLFFKLLEMLEESEDDYQELLNVVDGESE